MISLLRRWIFSMQASSRSNPVVSIPTSDLDPALLFSSDTVPTSVTTEASTPPQAPAAPIAASPEFIEKVKGYHDSNFTHVSSALEHTEKQLRKSIAKSDAPGEITFTRLYTMLLGVWCEARLHKLLYEKGAFSEDERRFVYSANQLSERWQRALEIGLKKHVGLELDSKILKTSVTFSVFNIYTEIRGWISEHFSPAITLRNKISHGQWVKPFPNTQGEWVNSENFSICQSSIAALNSENLLTTTIKIDLIKEISVTINNLAVDSHVYKTENFDERHAVVSSIIEKLESADYRSYKTGIKGAYKPPA